jgi:hypothetical protein
VAFCIFLVVKKKKEAAASPDYARRDQRPSQEVILDSVCELFELELCRNVG